MADPDLLEQVARALMPMIEQALSDAVIEGARRAQRTIPDDGVLTSALGAHGRVTIPGAPAPIDVTIVGNLAVGDKVRVVFYGNGVADAYGPIP